MKEFTDEVYGVFPSSSSTKDLDKRMPCRFRGSVVLYLLSWFRLFFWCSFTDQQRGCCVLQVTFRTNSLYIQALGRLTARSKRDSFGLDVTIPRLSLYRPALWVMCSPCHIQNELHLLSGSRSSRSRIKKSFVWSLSSYSFAVPLPTSSVDVV